MVSWVELVTKQFNASAAASEWFLGHMADDTWWPMQVSTYSPNAIPLISMSNLGKHINVLPGGEWVVEKHQHIVLKKFCKTLLK